MTLHINESSTEDLAAILEKYRPDLRLFGGHCGGIHQHPELSNKESNTAALVASYLRAQNFAVQPGMGGHGVVGILANGAGKTVTLRAELDAVPIKEETGLAYASSEWAVDEYGDKRPVSHACGHDMHATCLMAASKLLLESKAKWSGTLIVLFQPNEEHPGGARQMVDDGLYDKVPVPDVVLGQHTLPLRAGTVNLREGPVLTAADTVRIRLYGNGPWAGQIRDNPQISTDPIALAALILVRIQSIISLEISPYDFATIRAVELHAGKPGDDMVEYADMALDVKAYKSEIQDQIYEAIKRIVDAECKAFQIQKPATITRRARAPLTSNVSSIVRPLKTAFRRYFGENAGEGELRTACEDFSILATAIGKPYAFWFIGVVDPDTWDKAAREGSIPRTIPSNHSPWYAPVIESTLRTGTDAMALAALTFLH